MPQAVDLVLNNGAGTPVAKTFSLLAPAAGYGSLAEWALKEGTISSVFPRITAMAQNSSGSASRASSKSVRIKFRMPSSYTDPATGLTNVASAFEADLRVSVPADFPEALKNDAVAFTTNLIAFSGLVKAMIRDGLPAT